MNLQDIRDGSAAQSALAASKRADELLLAVADVYAKIDALTRLTGPDELDYEQLTELGATLHDRAHRDRIMAAAARLGREDPGGWLARKREEARRQSRIPDRGTVSEHATPGSPVVAVEVGADGKKRMWRQSPLQPNGPGGP
jgi:hypothetical protein